MDEEFLLAINGEWDALLAALRDNRTLAHQTDLNGMTLLHWVCLHQDIPTEVLIKIVFANPHAVNVPNEAGHLPIDLAVQAECEERILEVLRAADKSRQEQDEMEEPEPSPPLPPVGYSPISLGGPYAYTYPEGETDDEDDMTFDHPRYFASPQHPQGHQDSHHHPAHAHHQYQQQQPQQQHGSSRDFQSPTQSDLPLTMTYGVERKPLYSVYSGAAHPGALHSKSMSLAEDRLRHLDSGSEEFNSFRMETASDSAHLGNKWQQHSKTSASASVAKGTAFPPRWKQSRSCHVCASRFTTLTRRRHHCRNCGFSVCGQHSTNRVPLPRFDLPDPQRVCDKCFLGGRHVNGMKGFSGAASSVGGGGRGAMSVTSGAHSDHPHLYDHPQQHYDHQYQNQQLQLPQHQLQQHQQQQHQQLQYGGRRDSFGSFRP